MKVTKPAALDPKTPLGDRPCSAFTGKHDHGVTSPRQERGEETAHPARAEHRHTKTVKPHVVDLSFESVYGSLRWQDIAPTTLTGTGRFRELRGSTCASSNLASIS
jgi:hypothetical protein